ncbi:MAG TPA: Gfo/Idh/MocA family oxidoreductase [Puia sp.]|nr:Gfo/Idh/MocA family oxidoreductase [Puia sp.]
MFTNYLIDKFKSFRKQNYLNQLVSYRHQYAFIGAGNHSIANLYPCIRQLNVPLRYICTKRKTNAEKMATSFPGCTGTADVNLILQDQSVRGVFVSAQPFLQPGFTRQLLEAGKSVFVEKPPAFSLAELEQLIGLQGAQVCMPGLQRRFSTINHFLQKRRFSAATYSYRYLTGQYPEGDPVYELFIHPVDNALQLFGNAKLVSIQKAQSGSLLTWFIHLEHKQGARGVLELSNHYSWSSVREMLEINTEKEILEASYPLRLTGIQKPTVIAGFPSEKFMQRPGLQKIYIDNQGTIPVALNNSLVSQGFFGEIDHFVRQVEEGKTSEAGDLSSLRNAYMILEQLKAAGA